MDYSQLVPFLDKNGKWQIALSGSGGVIPFEKATTTDLTQNQFSWEGGKAYVDTFGGKVSTKNPTTGEKQTAFLEELNKLVYQDENGNLSTSKANELKLNKILEGAAKIAGFASTIWDFIDPSRIAKRNGNVITNPDGTTVTTPVDNTEIPLGKTVPKAPITPTTPAPANFDILKFIQSNVYVVAVILIALVLVLTPKAKTGKEKEKESTQNNTILYVAIGFVVLLLFAKNTTTV